MANPTSNFNWQMPTNTDLVKDLPADFEVFGQAVDTALGDLLGGTSGQILAKNSNTNMDFVWINNDQGDITAVNVSSPITGGGSSGAVTIGIDDGTTAQKGAVQLEDSTSSTSTTKAATPNSVKSAYDLAGGAIAKSLIDAEGDLIVGDAADAVQRLAIGSNGNVLTVDTSVDGKIKWAAPASSSGPAFSVYRNQSQTLTSGTWNKVQFEVEDFDTDSCYDNATNYRFTPNKSGYYQFNYNAQAESGYATLCALYKNGSIYHYGFKSNPGSSQNNHGNGSFIAYANGTTDYFEVYLNPSSGYAGTAVVNWGTDRRSAFSGVWIRS